MKKLRVFPCSASVTESSRFRRNGTATVTVSRWDSETAAQAERGSLACLRAAGADKKLRPGPCCQTEWELVGGGGEGGGEAEGEGVAVTAVAEPSGGWVSCHCHTS